MMRRAAPLLAAALGLLCALGPGAAAGAGPGPVLEADIHHYPTNFEPPRPLAAKTQTQGGPGADEVQLLAVEGTAGSFALDFEGETTAALRVGARNAEVRSALRALAAIGPSGVSVGSRSEGNTRVYEITFEGPLAETDVPGLTGTLTPDATYVLDVRNAGGAPTEGPLSLQLKLPAGLSLASAGGSFYLSNGWAGKNGNEHVVPWECAGNSPGDTTVDCAIEEGFIPPHTLDDGLFVRVAVDPGILGSQPSAGATVSGGGAPDTATATEPTPVSSSPAPFGILAPSFDPRLLSAAVGPTGPEPELGAGARPERLTIPLDFASVPDPTGSGALPAGNIRDAVVDLPPGFLGNPTAVKECSQALFTLGECPTSSQVGRVDAKVTGFPAEKVRIGIFNLTHPLGTVSDIAFAIAANPVHIRAALDPARDYAITTTTANINETLPPLSTRLTFWGVPAARSHDDQRCRLFDVNVYPSDYQNGDTSSECKSDGPLAPFLTAPLRCAPAAPIVLRGYDSWQQSGVFGPPITRSLGAFGGCDRIPFAPAFSLAPTSDRADSPAGLDLALQVPQHEGCKEVKNAAEEIEVRCERATSPLRDARVSLPRGLTVNPAAANGLGACSEAEISLGTDEPVGCPKSSEIATVKVATPLLPDPVEGLVYLASPYRNPFDSLLAAYIVLADPARGLLVKIPGRVEADPADGRLTGTFEKNPELPFSRLELHFKAGPHATLITPPACGTYAASADFSPWSGGAATHPRSGFVLSGGAGGAACPSGEGGMPDSPSFDAGTLSPLSRRYSPFVLHLRRTDGSQRFGTLGLTLPPGLTGRLAGTALCPEAALAAAEASSGKDEQASPSCPAGSHVGRLVAGAGAGSPYYAAGDAYLAPPYKGAPVSLAAIVPAVAGPFDLGTVVIRTPLRIDPRTGQIGALSDPIPRLLEGIPTDVRSVDLVLDRPDFTLTGSSCDPSRVGGLLTSTLGQAAPLSSPYQLSDCRRLPFKPRLRLRLKGGTRRAAHPKLIATLHSGPGQAGARRLQVKLPRSAFLDQAHIRTVCTRVQFAAGAGNGARCPGGSVYGRARVKTPLLAYPLSGPVLLRSSNHKLPDLVIALHGPPWQPLAIELHGKTDSVRGALRNTFEALPDAPFTKARLVLFGGDRGLIVNSRNLCAHRYRALAVAVAHNNAAARLRPRVRTSCKPAEHRRHGHHRRRGRH